MRRQQAAIFCSNDRIEFCCVEPIRSVRARNRSIQINILIVYPIKNDSSTGYGFPGFGGGYGFPGFGGGYNPYFG